MFRGDRRFLATLVGCLALAGIAVSESIERQAKDHQAKCEQQGCEYNQGPPQQADTDHAGVPAFAERFISNPEPGNRTERENRDLAAQENTAAWAFWIVLLSFGQVVLSGFGLLALVRTLKQGDETLTEARNAIDAGRLMGEAQTRAYLSVTRADFSIRSKLSRFEINLNVHNSGQTPAVNIAYYCTADVTDWIELNTFPKIDTIDHQSFVNSITPNQLSKVKIICHGIALRWVDYLERWEKVTENTSFGDMPMLRIFGVLFYEDVFGKTFQSKFAFSIAGVPPTGETFVQDDLPIIQARVPTFEPVAERKDHLSPQD